MLRPAFRTFLQTAGHGTDAQSVAAQNSTLTWAYLELATRREWGWRRKSSTAVTTTVGNAVISSGIPADLERVLNLQLSFGGISHEPVEEITPDLLDNYLAQDTGTGEPVFWSYRNGQLVVYPKPDKVYASRLDYVRTVASTEFDDDADVLPFPEEFHPVIAWRALSILGFRQRDSAEQGIAKQEYEALLRKMEQADERNASNQKRVKTWAGWGMMRR